MNDVKVDVLIVGEYPGDGKPKPVAFPAPESVRKIHDESLPYIDLKSLLELKIASGMTAPHRPRDLDDVIQLIRINALKKDYSDQLNPFVRDKFMELWQAAPLSEDYQQGADSPLTRWNLPAQVSNTLTLFAGQSRAHRVQEEEKWITSLTIGMQV